MTTYAMSSSTNDEIGDIFTITNGEVVSVNFMFPSDDIKNQFMTIFGKPAKVRKLLLDAIDQINMLHPPEG